MEANAKLLTSLESHPDLTLAEAARRERANMMEDVTRIRERETREDRDTDERFE